MNDLTTIPFAFEDQTILIADNDGYPCFLAVDVCKALNIKNSRKAVRQLDRDERAEVPLRYPSSNGVSQVRRRTVLSEAGVFTLALRCRDAMKPGTAPYKLRKWVTGVVLPAFRRGHATEDVRVTQFAEEALKVMGGVVQAIIRKEMREFRESLLPVAVNETILSGRYAVVEGISSLGVLELCGYGKGQRPKGSSQFVTRRLVRYHVLRSSQVRFPSVGGSVVHLFDEMTSREWLSSGGKTEIDHFVAQKRGQGRLRLIAKPTLAEIAKDRLRDRRA